MMQVMLSGHRVEHGRMNAPLWRAPLKAADGVLRNTDELAKSVLRKTESGAESECACRHVSNIRKRR